MPHTYAQMRTRRFTNSRGGVLNVHRVGSCLARSNHAPTGSRLGRSAHGFIRKQMPQHRCETVNTSFLLVPSYRCVVSADTKEGWWTPQDRKSLMLTWMQGHLSANGRALLRRNQILRQASRTDLVRWDICAATCG